MLHRTLQLRKRLLQRRVFRQRHGEYAAAFGPQGGHLFLGLTEAQEAFGLLELAALRLRPLFLALLVGAAEPGEAVRPGEGGEGLHEGLGHGLETAAGHRSWAALVAQEAEDGARGQRGC